MGRAHQHPPAVVLGGGGYNWGSHQQRGDCFQPWVCLTLNTVFNPRLGTAGLRSQRERLSQPQEPRPG